MTKDEALAFFKGNQSALARALDMDQSTVNKWRVVPPLRQLQLESVTGGELRAGPECDKYRVKPAKEVA